MKVLVIGGSGFIGTRLLTALGLAGHEVRNLDLLPSALHSAVTTIGDVRDLAAVTAASAGTDVVVNLAAAHRDDVRPLSVYESVNVGGARVVAEAAVANGVERILFTSTVAVYGLKRPHPDEDSPAEPFNEYGRTKLLAEGVLRSWADQDAGRSLAIVRPAVVFGEENRGNVYTLANQVVSGRFLFIGDGSNRKSMGYVGNVVAYLLRCLEAPAGVSVTNYADSPDLTTRELVALIRETLGIQPSSNRALPKPVGLAAGHAFDVLSRVTGRTFPISAVRVQKFCAETTIDTTRLRASGFEPTVAVPDAVRRTVQAEFGRVVPTTPGSPVA